MSDTQNCPKCGEQPTHGMPLKRVRNGTTYAERWCANAHGWLTPESPTSPLPEEPPER